MSVAPGFLKQLISAVVGANAGSAKGNEDE